MFIEYNYRFIDFILKGKNLLDYKNLWENW